MFKAQYAHRILDEADRYANPLAGIHRYLELQGLPNERVPASRIGATVAPEYHVFLDGSVYVPEEELAFLDLDELLIFLVSAELAAAEYAGTR